MRIRHIISALEDFAPLALQESWDNSGLQTGDPDAECTGVMLCVDPTEAVVREASERGCNLVVSHHPLLFRGLKHITGATPAERCVIESIRRGVAVYSSHTALDSAEGGVSYELARSLGARPLRTLHPLSDSLLRLTVYAPRDAASDVRAAIADCIADDSTIVSSQAEASNSVMTADKDGLPLLDIIHRPLTSMTLTVADSRRRALEAALSGMGSGVTYEFERLSASDSRVGLGVVAELARDMSADELIASVKSATGARMLRCNAMPAEGSTFRHVAVCGGAGGEFIADAVRAGADAYITADVRYHDFAEWADRIFLIDAGHYETESCTKSIFMQLIKEKFANFAVYISASEQNPINYL